MIIVIVRHGSYNSSTKELNPRGELEIKSLGNQLSEILGDLSSTRLISSGAKRAKGSAQILKKVLNLPKEPEINNVFSQRTTMTET